MAIHCVAAEHSGLIKKIKKETNKESSWVRLWAFPTNVGRPNNCCWWCRIFLSSAFNHGQFFKPFSVRPTRLHERSGFRWRLPDSSTPSGSLDVLTIPPPPLLFIGLLQYNKVITIVVSLYLPVNAFHVYAYLWQLQILQFRLNISSKKFYGCSCVHRTLHKWTSHARSVQKRPVFLSPPPPNRLLFM